MTINPADVLLDKIEELEQEKLRREQFVNRYADDPKWTEAIRLGIVKIKELRYDIRALNTAINKLDGPIEEYFRAALEKAWDEGHRATADAPNPYLP